MKNTYRTPSPGSSNGMSNNIVPKITLSLGPIASGRLKNLRNVDKWSSLRLCHLVIGVSVTRESGLYLCSLMGQIAIRVL